jgi:hypothetical protein
MRSRYRCSMCPAIHISSRSWLRSSSTHEPSDPPLRVVNVFACHCRRASSALATWRADGARARVASTRHVTVQCSHETVARDDWKSLGDRRWRFFEPGRTSSSRHRRRRDRYPPRRTGGDDTTLRDRIRKKCCNRAIARDVVARATTPLRTASEKHEQFFKPSHHAGSHRRRTASMYVAEGRHRHGSAHDQAPESVYQYTIQPRRGSVLQPDDRARSRLPSGPASRLGPPGYARRGVSLFGGPSVCASLIVPTVFSVAATKAALLR